MNQMIEDAKEKMQRTKSLIERVDNTIESVCEKVNGNDLCPREYADTVKALAALVEARAKLV